MLVSTEVLQPIQ